MLVESSWLWLHNGRTPSTPATIKALAAECRNVGVCTYSTVPIQIHDRECKAKLLANSSYSIRYRTLTGGPCFFLYHHVFVYESLSVLDWPKYVVCHRYPEYLFQKAELPSITSTVSMFAFPIDFHEKYTEHHGSYLLKDVSKLTRIRQVQSIMGAVWAKRKRRMF